ncbi:hypothetical protein HDR58_09455 [bacterium]|nr:hypothetical protein [bacterium]
MFSQAYAKTVKVEALSDMSTANPPSSVILKLIDPLDLTDDIQLKTGEAIEGDIIDIISPKRLKRDARFSVKLKSYTDENGKTYSIEDNIVASYKVPTNKKDLAKNAALGVGSYFVKGLSVGVAAIEGAVKNTEDNRLKSSVVSVYESSPLSYVEKGEDIDISRNQIFYLKFPNPSKTKNSKRRQNNTYTIEKE